MAFPVLYNREDIRVGSSRGRVADLRLRRCMLFITIEMGGQVSTVVGALILARHDEVIPIGIG